MFVFIPEHGQRHGNEVVPLSFTLSILRFSKVSVFPFEGQPRLTATLIFGQFAVHCCKYLFCGEKEKKRKKEKEKKKKVLHMHFLFFSLLFYILFLFLCCCYR